MSDTLDSPGIGAALLGMFGGVKCALKVGHDPLVIFQLAYAQAIANATDEELRRFFPSKFDQETKHGLLHRPERRI